MTPHINPWGGIEPCPIVQFTKESIPREADNRSLKENSSVSRFLRDFRTLAPILDAWLIVLDGPTCSNAWSRSTAPKMRRPAARLAKLERWKCTLAYNPGQEIPGKKNWLYRWRNATGFK